MVCCETSCVHACISLQIWLRFKHLEVPSILTIQMWKQQGAAGTSHLTPPLQPLPGGWQQPGMQQRCCCCRQPGYCFRGLPCREPPACKQRQCLHACRLAWSCLPEAGRCWFCVACSVHVGKWATCLSTETACNLLCARGGGLNVQHNQLLQTLMATCNETLEMQRQITPHLVPLGKNR